MRRIDKGPEPHTLTRYRASIKRSRLNDTNVYNDFGSKSKEDCESEVSGNLRRQLLQEQGHLCCYCMSRIRCHTSKIEHFKDQKNHRELQITYQNLFVVCAGNEGSHTSNNTATHLKLISH